MAAPLLEGKISNLPADKRAQETIKTLGKDLEFGAAILDVPQEEIIQDVQNLNVDLFPGVTLQAEPEEIQDYIKKQVAKKVIDEFGKYEAAGNLVRPEERQLIDTWKEQYRDKNFIEIAGETSQEFANTAKEFFKAATDTVADPIKRKGLVDTVGDSINKGFENPAQFFNALATLSVDALVDQVPTGIADLSRDIAGSLTGGTPTPQRLNVDLIKGSVTGESTEELSQAQPAAAFISSIVPFILRGGRTVKALEAKGATGINKALRLATDEAVFEASTSSAGQVEGDTIAQRNAQRGVNSVTAFLAALGIEGGIQGVRKIAQRYRARGLRNNNLTETVVDDLQQRLTEAQTGQRKIDTDKIVEVLERDGKVVYDTESQTIQPASGGDPNVPKGAERQVNLRDDSEIDTLFKETQKRVEQAQKNQKAILQQRTDDVLNVELEQVNELGGNKAVAYEMADDVVDTGEYIADGLSWIDRQLANVKALPLSRYKTAKFTNEAIEAFTSVFNWQKRLNRKINHRANYLYASTAKSLKMSADKFQEKYMKSGIYRAWKENIGSMMLSNDEVAAFSKLDDELKAYNEGFNFPLAKQNGFDFQDVEHFTDARKGRQVGIIDVTDDAQLEQAVRSAGVELIEFDKTKYAIMDYANSKKELLADIDQGRFYYENKHPYLFDADGKLREDIIQMERNVSRELFMLERDGQIKLEQLSKLKTQLQKQGYTQTDINSLIKDITDGNLDTSGIRKRVTKMFVGSLKQKRGKKIGVNLDPINALRKQNIDLGKKFFRDTMSNNIDTVRAKIDKKLADGKLTDHQVNSLRAEQFALNGLDDLVHNRPGPIERIIIEGAAQATGKDVNSIFNNLREWMDSSLAVQASLKLAMNMSGSAMNILEAMRTTSAEKYVLGAEYWSTLGKAITPTNVGNFVEGTMKRMAKSKKYKMFYLEDQYDSAINTAFKGKVNWGTKISQNKITQFGMAPFTGSIMWGKVFTYNIAEAVGKKKGLSGDKLDDFIFDYMTRRSQVQDLNVSQMSRNDTVVKSALFLKNFMINMFEFETDNWRRLYGSMLKKQIDKDAARQILAFNLEWGALFGAGSSPTVILMSHMLGAGSAIGNTLTGGLIPNWDLYENLQAAPQGSMQGYFARGAVSELLGLSTRQFSIDISNGLNQKNIALQTFEDVTEFGANSWMHARTAMQAGDPYMFADRLAKESLDFIGSQSVVVGRTRKAADIIFEGKQRTLSGTPIEVGIEGVGSKAVRATGAALGFNTTTNDINYAQERVGTKLLKNKSDIEKYYADEYVHWTEAGDSKRADAVLEVAAKNGYSITKRKVKAAFNRVEQTRKQRFLKRAGKRGRAYLQEKVPGILEE